MSELRKNDVKQTIVSVAQDIFSKFGFRKTTMNEIAQAVHKAKSSLYHYFRSKEEVFRAIVEKEGRIAKEKIIEAIKKEDTPQKKIRAYVITRMHIMNQLANFYSAMKDEYLKQYSYIEKLRANYDKEEIRIMKDLLNEGCEKGIFQIKDLEVTAVAIITAMKGMEYSWINEIDVSKTEKKIDSLLEILFNGIVKR